MNDFFVGATGPDARGVEPEETGGFCFALEEAVGLM